MPKTILKLYKKQLISLFAYANVVSITFVFLTYRLFTKFTENFVSRIVVAARVKRRRARTRGLYDELGLIDPNNKLSMFIKNAEIHIYMPKANITEALKSEWMTKLNTIDPNIKFEIKALEDFIN